MGEPTSRYMIADLQRSLVAGGRLAVQEVGVDVLWDGDLAIPQRLEQARLAAAWCSSAPRWVLSDNVRRLAEKSRVCMFSVVCRATAMAQKHWCRQQAQAGVSGTCAPFGPISAYRLHHDEQHKKMPHEAATRQANIVNSLIRRVSSSPTKVKLKPRVCKQLMPMEEQ